MSLILEYIVEVINKLKDLDKDNKLTFTFDSSALTTLNDSQNSDSYLRICHGDLAGINLYLFIGRQGWSISRENHFAYILLAEHRISNNLDIQKMDANITAQTYYDIVTGNIPFVIAQSNHNPYNAPLYTQFYEKLDGVYKLITTIFNYIPDGWDTDSSKPLTRSKHLTIDQKLVFESSNSDKTYSPTSIALLKSLNFSYLTALDSNTNLSKLEPQNNITEDVVFVINI